MTAKLIHRYEVVIGFETHTQLATKSKIFSRAPTAFGADPSTQACAVDLALPGTLPVMNREAVACAIKLGLALGSHIAPVSIFARKNYFYPDLPKGYHISQFEIPVVQGGEVEFFLGDEKKTVRLVRAHLEEDAGKSLHEDFIGQSGIDLNRAGTPLLEIVTEPDMRSSEEAVAYAKELHKIVTWIGICDGNMHEGSFRCDANVSVRKPGAELGTRREIKNLNSFKFMQQAIDYEIRWQIEQIEDGHAIQQATVLFDPDTGANGRIASHHGRPFCGGLWPARVRRHHAHAEQSHGGVLRSSGQSLQPAQAGQQLDHGRGVTPPEHGGDRYRAGPCHGNSAGRIDRPHCRRHDLQQRRQAGV